MLPIEKSSELVSPYELIVTLSIPASLSWFEGHFESQPVLPGVAQISYAMYYAAQRLNISAEFLSLEQVKFLAPVLPSDDIVLHLTTDETHQKLQFRYLAGSSPDTDQVLISSGKIRLCP